MFALYIAWDGVHYDLYCHIDENRAITWASEFNKPYYLEKQD